MTCLRKCLLTRGKPRQMWTKSPVVSEQVKFSLVPRSWKISKLRGKSYSSFLNLACIITQILKSRYFKVRILIKTQSRLCLKLGGKIRANLFGGNGRKIYKKDSKWVRGQKDDWPRLFKNMPTVHKEKCAVKKTVHTAAGKSLIILSSHWTSKLNNSRHFHSYWT